MIEREPGGVVVKHRGLWSLRREFESLPGYQKILFSQVFSKLYVKNPVNISFKLFSAFYRRFKPTVRAFSINSFPKLSFSSEKP